MTSRRDDISASERVQIAIEMLVPNRPLNKVAQLCDKFGLSRQTLYDIEDKGLKILEQGLQPGAHGPQPQCKTVEVDKNRLQRAVLSLAEHGVSQRGTAVCLQELLDTKVSASWVNGELAKLENQAAQVNTRLNPSINESLSADEIFSNGQPNLLVVGNESLYIYALTRQESCDGDTWACVLLDTPETIQLASDAGKGLLAGSKEAGVSIHQLDWDHLLRPMFGQLFRLERAAYAALEKVEERVAFFDKSHTPYRLTQHFTQWEKLDVIADEQIAKVDAFRALAQGVNDCFALIDLESGQLLDKTKSQSRLQEIGQDMAEWSGRIYQKIATNLESWSPLLFAYQYPLQQALDPLYEQYGKQAVSALCLIWQCEADEKRHPLGYPEKQVRQQIWEQSLDEAWELLGEGQLWSAWQTLSTILSRSWRGSMLSECLNSLLRPVLEQRKQTDQGCLEIFRFLRNTRIFKRGKRAGNSPAQLVGLELPDDPFTLLGLAPKV